MSEWVWQKGRGNEWRVVNATQAEREAAQWRYNMAQMQAMAQSPLETRYRAWATANSQAPMLAEASLNVMPPQATGLWGLVNG